MVMQVLRLAAPTACRSELLRRERAPGEAATRRTVDASSGASPRRPGGVIIMDRPTDRHLVRGASWSARPLLTLLAALLLAACSAPPATTVTLYVSPSGSDASGNGSAAQPYRTLSTAVSQAPTGATILLADGLYSAASGETFPIDISGRTVRGQSANGTIVAGTSAALYGLTATSGTTSVSDLTVRGFGTLPTGANVRILGGTVLLEDLIASDGARFGIETSGGTVTLRSVTVSGNEGDNIHAEGSTRLEVYDSFVRDSNADGIDIRGTTTLLMRRTHVSGNQGSGVELSDSSVADLGTLSNPGSNTVKGSALRGDNEAQLEDDRPTGGAMITAVGNDFGVAVSGVKTGPAVFGSVWRIDSLGNQIDFGPAD
jgi:hypothetical protein